MPGPYCSNQEDMYVCLIFEGPKLISPDFNRRSKDGLRIGDSIGVGRKVAEIRRRPIFLLIKVTELK